MMENTLKENNLVKNIREQLETKPDVYILVNGIVTLKNDHLPEKNEDQ